MTDLPEVTFADVFSVTRADGFSTVRNAAGSVVNVAAATPRYRFTTGGVAEGLLVEAGDTEHASNPWWNGVVAGTAPTGSPPSGGSLGTRPTGVSFPAIAGSVVAQIVGTQDVAGERFLVARFYGTANSEVINANCFSSLPVATSGADGAPIEFAVAFVLLGGSASAFSALRVSASGPFSPVLLGNDVASSLTLNVPVESSVVRAQNVATGSGVFQPRISYTMGSGLIDCTIGIAARRLRRSGWSTRSMIRPEVGGTGPVTAARDDVRGLRADLWRPGRLVSGINTGAGAMVEFTALSGAPTGERTLLRWDDGTDNNSLEYYLASGTLAVTRRCTVSGTPTVTTIGTISADTPQRLAISETSTGWAAVVTGGSIVTGANAAVFDAVRDFVGGTASGNSFNGLIRGRILYSTSRTNALLLTLVGLDIPFATLAAEARIAL